MRKTNCNAIRRELDEIMLGESHRAPVSLHLQQCSDCQEFHQGRTKLRQLVGSLETVEAPADFDFRLRARLANEKAESAHWLMFAQWSPGARGLVLAGFVLLLGVVVVLNHWRGPRNNATVARVENPATQPTLVLPKDTAGVVLPKPVAPANGAVAANSTPKQLHKTVVAVSKLRQPLLARDFSLSPASVVRQQESVATAGDLAVFPIDTSYQSLKVSLDDGNGTWHTISLPTVSFGSQRVLATGSLSNQLSPKGVW